MALGIKLKNIGALGQEMADIISPPEDGQPDPAQMAQQLEQAKAVIQQLQELADDNKAKMVIAQGNAETQKAIAAAKAEVDLEKTRMDNETKLAVAELGAKVDRLTLFLEERGRLGVQAHDIGQAAMDHEHAKELAGMAHQQALEAAQVGHEQALQQGEQQHAQAIEAAQIPPPIDPNAQQDE
jgi:hypothetical protein